jgi:hypothetical protein
MHRALLFAGLLGCSNSPAPGDGGGMDAQSTEAGDASSDAPVDAKLVPRGIVVADFSPADAGCSGSIVSIGKLPDMFVDDGSSASIVCTVHPMGQKFNVTITANAKQSSAGMDLVGSLSASGAQMVDVMLRDPMGMPIMKMMCNGTYPTNGGISAGKVWIHLSCMGSMIDPPPMGCPVELEARVENCAL